MKATTLRLRMTLFGCAVAVALAGTAAAQPVKTVRVWHTETNPASQAAVAEIVKRFEATHPDVEIKSLDVVTGDQPSGQGAPAPFLVAVSGQ